MRKYLEVKTDSVARTVPLSVFASRREIFIYPLIFLLVNFPEEKQFSNNKPL